MDHLASCARVVVMPQGAAPATVRVGDQFALTAETRADAPDDRRRPYALTDAGRDLLRKQLVALDRIASTGLDRLSTL